MADDTNWLYDSWGGTSGNVLDDINHDDAPDDVHRQDRRDIVGNLQANYVYDPGTFELQYGTLTIWEDGYYSYTLYNQEENPSAYATIRALLAQAPSVDEAPVSYVAGAYETSQLASYTLTISIFASQVEESLGNDTNWIFEEGDSISGNVLLSIPHDGAPDGVPRGDVADGEDVLGVSFPGTFAGAYGTLTLDLDGSYVYRLYTEAEDPVAYAAVQSLTSSQTAIETFYYTPVGAFDGEDYYNDYAYFDEAFYSYPEATLTITIFGQDEAVAEDDSNWLFETDLAATGNVLLSIPHYGAPDGLERADRADHGSDDGTLGVGSAGTFNGTYGRLTLAEDGSYSYALYTQAENAAAYATVRALDDGARLLDSFSYVMEDHLGGDGGSEYASGTLTIAIFGESDLDARDDSNWLFEDGDPATGNVRLTIAHPGAPDGAARGDTADDGAADRVVVSAVSPLAGHYGVLTLGADGGYSYRLYTASENPDAYAAVQRLNLNDTLADSFTYRLTGGTVFDDATLTITIFGQNDVTAADDSNWLWEGDAPVTGNVLRDVAHPGAPDGVERADAADVGTSGDTLAVTSTGAFDGMFGRLTLGADGNYSYHLYSEAENADGYARGRALREGETATETFAYTATDSSNGDSGQAALTLTIFGENDAPQFDPDQTRLVTFANQPILLEIEARDPEDGTLAVTIATGALQFGRIDQNADGSYTYIPNQDAMGIDVFEATATDSDGLSTIETLTMVVRPLYPQLPDIETPMSMPDPGLVAFAAP